MAGADLLTALRELLQRHDGAESPEDVGQLLDDVSAALRRARGRVNRFAKRAAEQAPPKAPAPAAEKRTEAAPKPVPAAPPAPERADVKLPPEPKSPPPPNEAPETPPEPPRSRWPERLNSAVLAFVCAVIVPVIGVQAVCSLVARAVRAVARRAAAPFRSLARIVRRAR